MAVNGGDDKVSDDNPRIVEPWMQGYMTDQLCQAYRATMAEKIEGMEKNISNTIKISLAIAGFIISLIVLLSSYIR